MSEPTDVALWVFGGGGGLVGMAAAVKWLVGSKVKRGEQAEERAEDERDHKLDEVLSVVQRMERELAVMGHKLSTQAVEAGELKARIEGMSGNYGGRLGVVEQRLAVLESRRRR